jgi:hypothetical protein
VNAPERDAASKDSVEDEQSETAAGVHVRLVPEAGVEYLDAGDRVDRGTLAIGIG